MIYHAPSRWFILCMGRPSSEFSHLNGGGVHTISVGEPGFSAVVHQPFDQKMDRVFKLCSDFSPQSLSATYSNIVLFQQWMAMVSIGWKPSMSVLDFLVYDEDDLPTSRTGVIIQSRNQRH